MLAVNESHSTKKHIMMAITVTTMKKICNKLIAVAAISNNNKKEGIIVSFEKKEEV